jgi:hypothetical protein
VARGIPILKLLAVFDICLVSVLHPVFCLRGGSLRLATDN